MRHLFLIASVLLSGIVFSSPLTAQQIPTEVPPNAWVKACTDDEKPETCRIIQYLYISQEIDGEVKTIGKILGLTVLYLEDANSNERVPYMSIQMPLGVDLRVGGVARVDEGNETKLEYLRCRNSGCDASLRLDEDSVRALKGGAVLSVGFLPWEANEVSVVGVTLKGFTKAFNEIK